MSRWKYPFVERGLAEKHLRLAEKESKRKCFVKKITITKHFYKIFSSPAEYKKYKKVKGIK
ncbi:MAG TPA: hypothetical protein PLK35_00725 [Candidatus Moranbacteria bacterium]|nr:hypothetical protein [Candidatus Moranbacteria bacterium]